jgi:hypothetical protein
MMENPILIENIDAFGIQKEHPQICAQRRQNGARRWLHLGNMPDTRSFRHRRALKDRRIRNTSGRIHSGTLARWAIAPSMLGSMAITHSNWRSISPPASDQSIAAAENLGALGRLAHGY